MCAGIIFSSSVLANPGSLAFSSLPTKSRSNKETTSSKVAARRRPYFNGTAWLLLIERLLAGDGWHMAGRSAPATRHPNPNPAHRSPRPTSRQLAIPAQTRPRPNPHPACRFRPRPLIPWPILSPGGPNMTMETGSHGIRMGHLAARSWPVLPYRPRGAPHSPPDLEHRP